MFDIDNKIVHRDILSKNFACDLKKCKGACCIEGDSGAPLEEDEAEKIKEILPKIIDMLNDDAKKIIQEQGPVIIDIEGDLTTNIIGKGGACVFVTYNDEGIALCSIEQAWQNGLTDFRKPLSCHLYPIRIKKYNNFEAVNFHEWEICKDAIINGTINNIKVYEFLKEALIRKYGEKWYDELKLTAEEYIKQSYLFR